MSLAKIESSFCEIVNFLLVFFIARTEFANISAKQMWRGKISIMTLLDFNLLKIRKN
jgi:hypothetical protein